MRKSVVMLFVMFSLFVAACAPKPAAEQPAPTPQNASEPEAPAAAPEPDEFGRAVFTVTDAPVAQQDISRLEIVIADLEVHLAGAAGAEGTWKKLTGAKTTFDLVQLADVESLLLDTPLDPGKYTQMRFRIHDAEAIIKGTEYDLSVPSGTIKLIGVLEVEQGKTAAATVDFDIDKSIVIAGDEAYFKPTIKLTTFKDADVETENRTVRIREGTKVSEETHTPDTLWNPDQLNNSREDCLEACDDFCVEAATSDCETRCVNATQFGCESEDEDFCRETCEPYLHPGICKDGCQQDDSAECGNDLKIECQLGCNQTTVTCKSACIKDC